MSNASPSVPDTANRDTILLVDDESWFLNGIKRLLRLEGFTIWCATSGEEALAVLRTHPIRAIVADYRMPGMDGLKLLERVQAQYPDTVRILLTGFAERDLASRAIQRGIVFRLFSKPCNIFDLAMTIRQAFFSRMVEADAQGRVHLELRAWHLVSEVVREGILVIDAERTIYMVNPAVERLWGWKEEELVGEKVDRLLVRTSADLEEEALRSLLNGAALHPEAKQVHLEGQRKDGSSFPLELSIVQYQPAHVLLVARDVKEPEPFEEAREA